MRGRGVSARRASLRAGGASVDGGPAGLPSLALLTDMYQVTMMGGYHARGRAAERAVFDLFFRKLPFRGGFAVAAGLEGALHYLETLRFLPDDLRYLKSLGVFPDDFLARLARFRFTGTVHAIPEGTLVFPEEPLLRVEAPIDEAQLVETTLLNLINFQTLVATKAARTALVAERGSVLEFGLRRAQGVDGALSASRAAYVGGCDATSNLLAGKRFGIPVRGTHSHSWVLSFPSELSAFRAYARTYPDSSVLLVDTFDTLGSGVPNAITVGRELARAGHTLAGIRIDSGDLAWLATRARGMLDAAGLEKTRIVLSNDLDEWVIQEILNEIRRAARESGQDGERVVGTLTYGVGTALVTGKYDAALGGVYKLCAMRAGRRTVPKMKVTDNVAKITLPGVKRVLRLHRGDRMALDVICLEGERFRVRDGMSVRHPSERYKATRLAGIDRAEDLLVPVFVDGERVYESPALPEIRGRTLAQLASLDGTHRRLLNPHVYKVSLSPKLADLKERMLRELTGA